MEFATWYLEAQRGLRWKRKYVPLKTGKNLSEKLLCVLLIHLTEYSFPLKKPLAKTVHVEFAKWYLESHTGLWWKRNYPMIKTEKKDSEKLFCVLLIHLTDLQLSPQEAFRWDCSCVNYKVIFETPRGLWWKWKYPKIKTEKKVSEKLLCVLLVHLTELQLSPQETFR